MLLGPSTSHNLSSHSMLKEDAARWSPPKLPPVASTPFKRGSCRAHSHSTHNSNGNFIGFQIFILATCQFYPITSHATFKLPISFTIPIASLHGLVTPQYLTCPFSTHSCAIMVYHLSCSYSRI